MFAYGDSIIIGNRISWAIPHTVFENPNPENVLVAPRTSRWMPVRNCFAAFSTKARFFLRSQEGHELGTAIPDDFGLPAVLPRMYSNRLYEALLTRCHQGGFDYSYETNLFRRLFTSLRVPTTKTYQTKTHYTRVPESSHKSWLSSDLTSFNRILDLFWVECRSYWLNTATMVRSIAFRERSGVCTKEVELRVLAKSSGDTNLGVIAFSLEEINPE
jgi:hypothetical protein